MTDSYRTPYNDAYESCSGTWAKLLIYPGGLDPAEVTVRLGIEATDTKLAGTRLVNSLGRERIVKTTNWLLSSENHVKSNDLRRHLDWLLELLLPARPQILQLQSEPKVRMSIDCVWWSRGSGGPTLWPKQMLTMAELNLECSFDIYFADDDTFERVPGASSGHSRN